MKPVPIDSLSRLCAVTSLVTSVIAACSPPQYITDEPQELGGATSAEPRGGENSGGESGKSSGEAKATTGGTGATRSSSTSGSAGSVTGESAAATDGGTSSNLGGSTNASSSGGAIAGGASAAGGNSSINAGVGGTGSAGGSGAGGKTTAGGSDFGGTGAIAAGGTTTAGGTSSVAAGASGAGGKTAAGGSDFGGTGATAAGGTTTAGGTSSVAAGASGAGGTAGATSTSTGGAATDPDLVLWYKFDDTAGPAVLDSSGNGRNAKLETLGAGTAEYSTKHQVGTGALDLSSNSATVGAYVDMPSSLQTMGATSALTIAAWVQLKANPTAWQRIFDFGVYGAETSYIFLTPMHNRSTPNAPRFAMSASAKENEQGIVMTTPEVLTTGVWHHFVVVLAATATYTGKLYIDNALVGTNSAMTLHPSDLGATSENWLGRSQYPGDGLFNGYLDDFRVYKRALTASEIATLYAVR